MSESPATKNSLILRLRDHDDATAWCEFVEVYEPLVYRMMVRAGLQHADATEQAQEVLSSVAKAINRWEPDRARGKFRTWLYRIAKNRLADFWRKSQNLPQSGLGSEFVDVVEDVSTDPIQATFDQQYRKRVFEVAVLKIRERVNEKTWQAFWQTAIANQSVESVSEQLGMSPGGLYVAKSRVLKLLRESVQYLLESDDDPTISEQNGGAL